MRERLRQIAATERCVFHGTNVSGLALLTPHQAQNRDGLDGVPAVFASPHAETAIFMALLGVRSLGGWNTRRYDGSGFYSTASAISYLWEEHVEGYVYVLGKSDFSPRFPGSRQWVAQNAVKPIGTLAVHAGDLPDMTIVAESYLPPLLDIDKISSKVL